MVVVVEGHIQDHTVVKEDIEDVEGDTEGEVVE